MPYAKTVFLQETEIDVLRSVRRLWRHFATTVTAGLGSAGVGYGITKLLAGLAFCLGLVAVIVAGAELFTGNNLISWMAE